MSKSLSLYRTNGDLFAAIDNFFNRVFNEANLGFDFDFGKSSYPKIDVYDDNNEVVVEAAVPGLTQKDINVEWSNNLLTIHGASSVDKSKNENNIKHKELHRSQFYRTLVIDERDFDINHIDAGVKDGLLTVKVRRLQSKPIDIKKIEVK